MFAEVDPIFFAAGGHFGDSGFAGCFVIVVPDVGNGVVVIVPEFALVSSTVGGDGGVTGADGIGLAEFVEKIGEANFEKDIVFGEVFLKVFFVFDDSVFKSDTIRADEVGVDDEIIFGFEVANGHLLVPDFFGVRRFVVHAGGDGGDDEDSDGNNTKDAEKLFHFLDSCLDFLARYFSLIIIT